MNQPKVSIIMPVYNGEKYLKESIESILSQTFKDFEFLILNDGSTDQTQKILEQYQKKDARIRLLQHHNRGIVISLNKLIDLSSCNFIARMDADDIAEPERLEKQYNLMHKHPEVVLCGTNMKIFENAPDSFRIIYSVFGEDLMNRWILCLGPSFAHSSTMFQKKDAIECGKYNKTDYPAEDYGLWTRLSQKGQIAGINEFLIRYRRNEEGISAQNTARQEEKRITISRAYTNLLFKNNQIPDIDAINHVLPNYQLTASDKKFLSKLACLTGCINSAHSLPARAKKFFRLAIKLDRNRIDARINLLLMHFKKTFLINMSAKQKGKRLPKINIIWY
jgi:glycosyltransferase involved in cell wall biosynthesis